MKQRILSTALAVLCALTLLSGIAPAHAYAPPSGGDAVIQAEETAICYRTRDGVREMRIWSITYGEWITDWFPCPVQP